MEEDILHLEALDGRAVVVKDQAGGGVPDADLCAHLGVSVASSRQMVGMHDRSREWKRSVCSPNMSCDSFSELDWEGESRRYAYGMDPGEG